MDILPNRPRSRLALFRAPYTAFKAITTAWTPDTRPPRGQCLLWWLENAREQEHEFKWLRGRPAGLPIIVILAPAQQIHATLPLLNHIGALAPRAVLPSGQVVAPTRIRHLLSLPPASLAESVTAYLMRREIIADTSVQAEIRQVFALSNEVTTVSELARRMCMSRRTLGRHFKSAHLPVPSHWLQFARLLRVACSLQRETSPIGRVASRANYPDAFTLSNQMKRLIGLRPSEVRQYLGWEWLVEMWLQREIYRNASDSS